MLYLPARLVTLTLCFLILFASAFAQTVDVERWENGIVEAWWFNSNSYTKPEAETARVLWKQIGRPTMNAQDEWVGDYQIGDVSDVRMKVLRWSAEKGFVFFNLNAYSANVDELDYGDVVSASPSHVEIIPRRAPESRNKRKFVKVKWGQQRYLIEDHAVPDFCDYVVGLGSHNGLAGGEADFLSHRDDVSKPTAVLPTVPLEYREYVRRPIDTRITKIGKSYVEVDPENEWFDDLVTPVTINAGSDQKLKRGMRLHVLDSDEYDESVEITRVTRKYARGIIVRSVRKQPGVKLNE